MPFVRFVCPKCGGDCLEEVTGGIEKHRKVWLTLKTEEIRYDESYKRNELFYGNSCCLGFDCADCQFTIRNDAGAKLTTHKQVIRWLTENNMLVEEQGSLL